MLGTILDTGYTLKNKTGKVPVDIISYEVG